VFLCCGREISHVGIEGGENAERVTNKIIRPQGAKEKDVVKDITMGRGEGIIQDENK